MAPERLLPHHLAGELGETEADAQVSAEVEVAQTPQERYAERSAELRSAPDLDNILKKEYTERGVEVPEKTNLALLFIEGFQQTVREAQDFRTIAKKTTDPAERNQALAMYQQRQAEVKEFLAYGPSFEKAYREYTRKQLELIHFESLLNERKKIGGLMKEPSFKNIPAGDDALDASSRTRVEYVMRTEGLKVEASEQEMLASAKSIFEEGSPEYEQAVADLTREREQPSFSTKRDLVEREKSVQTELAETWEDPMVRYLWSQQERRKLLADFASGEDVLETPSTIEHLNKLHEFETVHDRTTIGGILVGPPGAGKTTLVRHYLEMTDRPNYAYLDLSEDVTRYLLYGSKSVEFRSPVEAMECLVDRLGKLDENGFTDMIAQNAEKFKDSMRIQEEEGAVVAIEAIQEELKRGTKMSELPPELQQKIQPLQEKINSMAEKAYKKELSSEFYHTVKRNGWRDGVLISALRQGNSIILDEFNKNKNWSLLYGLMTAKPGEKYFFADNEEYITIPEDWRMYFTANIGKRHGVFEMPEAMGSRGAGKLMKIDYPPTREELAVGMSAMANPDGRLIREEEDLRKMFVLISEVFPKVRQQTKNMSKTIPLSYRTIRDIGEKLIQYRDPGTKQPVYTPIPTSFDQAVYDVMLETHEGYEDSEAPKIMAELCVQAGLLHDPKLREKIEPLVGKAIYEAALKAHADHQEDYKEKMRQLYRDATESSADALPVTSNI